MKQSGIKVLIALLVVGTLLSGLFLFWLSIQITTFFPVDDAYISFRYAANWAAGHGPVFNIGERVEGYSNFLWVAMLALAAKGGLTPPLAARLFSMLALVAVGAILLWAVSTRSGRLQSRLVPVAMLSALIVLMSPHTMLNVLSGLEVPVAALFLLAGAVLLTTRYALAAPPLLLLFSLTRPEAIVISLAVCGATLYWEDKSRQRRALLGIAAGLVIPYGVYLLWRVLYYGSLLPNSVAAKMGAGLLQQLPGSFTYITDFLRFYWLLIPLVAASYWLAEDRQTRQARRLLLFVAATVVGLTLLTGSGDPYRSFGRYLYPIVPLLALLAALGARDCYRWCRRRSPPLAAGSLVAIAALCLVQQVQMIQPALSLSGALADGLSVRARNGLALITAQDTEPHLTGRPREDLNLYYFASWLLEHSSPDDLLATGEVGIAPYYSGVRVLDTFGLVDATIARLPGGPGEKMDTDYVFGREPTFISMKVDNSCLCGGTPADNQLLTHWRLRRDYDLVRIIPAGYAKLLLFQRRESPAFEVYYDFVRQFTYDRVSFANPAGALNQDPDLARDVVTNRSVMVLMTDEEREAGIQALAPAEALSSADFAYAELMRDWLGNWRRLLYHHPYTSDLTPEIRYPVRIPGSASLQFGIGMVTEFWNSGSGDGARYEILVVEQDGSQSSLFSEYIDPKNNPAHQGWQDFSLSLAPWAGQDVTLVFRVGPGPAGDSSNDFGGWGQPLILLE